MAGQWKEGDLVQRKSGGPKMIVDRVVHYSDDSTSVYCVWFDNNQRQNMTFHPTASRNARSRAQASAETNVCFWHKADMLNSLTNVRFWGKADMARACQYVR